MKREVLSLTIASILLAGLFLGATAPAIPASASLFIPSSDLAEPVVSLNLTGTGFVAAVLESIMIAPVAPIITLGGLRQFRAVGAYSDGSLLDITTVVDWTSSNLAVATIGLHTGLATGVAEGQTMITATLGGVSRSTTLTVTAAQLLAIMVTPASPSLPAGRTLQFEATGTYSYGPTAN